MFGFSQLFKTERKMPFLTNKKFILFFNYEILVKKFVDSYLESLWKHVMNSIIVVVQHSELVQTSRDMIYNLTCTIQAPGESVVSSGYVRTHHMFSRILNFLFVFFVKKIGFSRKNCSYIGILNLFWFLNENPFRTDQNKRQISWKKIRFRGFRIRENMWWTCYRLELGQGNLHKLSIYLRSTL